MTLSTPDLSFNFLIYDIFLAQNVIACKINRSCVHFIERSMAEELLKAPSVNIDHSASVKPVLMWSSNARKTSNASGVSSQSARFVELGFVHLLQPSCLIVG